MLWSIPPAIDTDTHGSRPNSVARDDGPGPRESTIAAGVAKWANRRSSTEQNDCSCNSVCASRRLACTERRYGTIVEVYPVDTAKVAIVGVFPLTTIVMVQT
ncbi:MAG: hypothetical protein D6725_17340 [Planctomycetota bacterium]|nr:MAG: hypothetical protein D6725_17340 [Planctomycetota bacterium]